MVREHHRRRGDRDSGKWQVPVRDAWEPRAARLAEDAAAVAEAAVRDWAGGALAAARTELQAANDARDEFLRRNNPVEPFWRRVLR